MAPREVALIVLCVVLLAVLVYLTFWGCKKCVGDAHKEKFANPDDKTLTKKEEELFEDIRKGKIDDAEIQKLIDGGKITEKMIEKFLANLELKDITFDDDEDTKGKKAASASLPAKKPAEAAPSAPAKKVGGEEGFEIEGFCDNDKKYAPAA